MIPTPTERVCRDCTVQIVSSLHEGSLKVYEIICSKVATIIRFVNVTG